MIAEILATGDEIRSGALIDSNSAYIAEEIEALGIKITRHNCVGDDENELTTILLELAGRADIIVVTGGLGPTIDDLGRDAAARAAGVSLELDNGVLKKIESFFISRQKIMSDNNTKQALFPQGATILENPIGTAPGFSLKIGRGTFFFLPGVPAEMRKMLKQQVIPRIRLDPKESYHYKTATISTFGLGESALEEKLSEFSTLFPGIKLGFRASFPEVQIKLYQKNSDEKALVKEQEEATGWIKEKLENKIVSLTGQPMATVVGDLLIQQQATLAVAESCTGGLIADWLTDRPGSSDFFLLSAVTYANDAKEKILGVEHTILKKFGAVHTKTAKAMAAGVQKLSGATYAIATTGIAGPAGGSPEKPVGTVYLGLAGPSGSKSRHFFSAFGKRRLNKKIFAAQALNLLRLELLSKKN
ncbi:MAG: competence/damage-inducible protein A [Pseudomonadota bacterium]|nr:competence/damage-inducible protein A [Pseudomonadota bacterium]